jgi:hypothetical protein
MPIQIRIRIRVGIKTMSILIRILPKVLHLLKNLNYFYLKFLTDFQYFPYFGQPIEIFLEKSLVYQIFHLLRIDTDPDPAI